MLSSIHIEIRLSADVSFVVPTLGDIWSTDFKLRHSRLFVSHLGLLHPRSLDRLTFVESHPRLFQSLHKLDSIPQRDPIVCSIIYQARSQYNKRSIFSNRSHSKDFEDFLHSLGWMCEAKSHNGFIGDFENMRVDIDKFHYYSNTQNEFLFLVSSLMQNEFSGSNKQLIKTRSKQERRMLKRSSETKRSRMTSSPDIKRLRSPTNNNDGDSHSTSSPSLDHINESGSGDLKKSNSGKIPSSHTVHSSSPASQATKRRTTFERSRERFEKELENCSNAIDYKRLELLVNNICIIWIEDLKDYSKQLYELEEARDTPNILIMIHPLSTGLYQIMIPTRVSSLSGFIPESTIVNQYSLGSTVRRIVQIIHNVCSASLQNGYARDPHYVKRSSQIQRTIRAFERNLELKEFYSNQFCSLNSSSGSPGVNVKPQWLPLLPNTNQQMDSSDPPDGFLDKFKFDLRTRTKASSFNNYSKSRISDDKSSDRNDPKVFFTQTTIIV
eukprot:TRINITY_DN3080_c0_g1_i1.p1 TRINITY_DN3080_c0_g1~~TRINITY_DN3080_c0_g1_i1.p1  ORF type:complete len:497 (+),score=97.46 TRINITY_DN3080_c0_g1_i1:180-1670(+)